MAEVATTLIVLDRGHAPDEAGDPDMNGLTMARVETAADYYHDNAAAFTEAAEDPDGHAQVHFEGGWAQSAAGAEKPADRFLAGHLMRQYGVELGIPESLTTAGVASRTACENIVHSARHIPQQVGRLALVTDMEQAPRFAFFAAKVFRGREVSVIEAPGSGNPAVAIDERRLLLASRVLYGWAPGPRSLLVADRGAALLGKVAGFQPGLKYGAA